MISIIIPVFNVSRFIRKTLLSVLSQSNISFEVIIVDDGSTDNTYEIVQQLLSVHQPKRVKVIKKENGGVSSARNKGIDEASGTYILFLDGDDYISTDLVKYLIPVCNEKKPDIICWGYDIVTENMDIILKYKDKYSYEYKEMTGEAALQNLILYRSMHICMDSALYKKEFLDKEKIKFTEGCANGEDQEFIIKCLSLSKKVIFLPETLSYYVQRENSTTNSYDVNRFEAIGAVERAARFIEEKNTVLFSTLKNQFQYELILEQFMYNFNSCYNHLLKYKRLKSKQARQYLLTELEGRWPGLYFRMQNLIENYKGNNVKFLFRIKCFQISPVLYFWMLRISNIGKHIKNYVR